MLGRQENTTLLHVTFSLFRVETDNGIAVQEQGTLKNFGGNPPQISLSATGSYAYTSPEGVPVAISYIADENGFQPSVRNYFIYIL